MKQWFNEMKPKLYMETTIPSYLISWPSRDLVIAGHQQITKDWWKNRKDAFDIYVSQLVIDEANKGDTSAAQERLKTIENFSVLDISSEVRMLVSSILASGIIPPKAAADAAHIAISAVHGMDFLMTWNCVHIANAVITKKVAQICEQHEFECPVICTPEELLGE